MLTLLQDAHFLHQSTIVLLLVTKHRVLDRLDGDEVLRDFVGREIDLAKGAAAEHVTNPVEIAYDRFSKNAGKFYR